MLEQLLSQSPTALAQIALWGLGLFYLLAAAWLLLAPHYLKTPGLIVVSVEQLPLNALFCATANRQRWRRLFHQIGCSCLFLGVLSGLWASQL